MLSMAFLDCKMEFLVSFIGFFPLPMFGNDHWCRSTFLIAMGEILSIFMRILGFHRKNLTYLDVWSPFWPRLFLHRGG